MAYASRSGRARTSASSPEAFAVCDRCGMWYNHKDLQFQYDWGGSSLINLRILVCDRCYDTPQEQNRSILIPPDPVPIQNPRVELFAQDSAGTSAVAGGDFNPDFDPDFKLIGGSISSNTTGSDYNTDYNTDFGASPYGYPNGIDPNAQMPFFVAQPIDDYSQDYSNDYGPSTSVQVQKYGVKLNLISVLSNGSAFITVNTNGPHNLSTGAQISVEGLTNKEACGAYNVTVVNPTQFTYAVLYPVPTASMANNYTRIITLNVGLPYNVTTIPFVGPK